MTNATKAALEASLKKLLLKKPLDKITIKRSDDRLRHQPDGVFIIILRISMILSNGRAWRMRRRRCRGRKTYETWQEGLQQILRQCSRINHLL